ncbi:MAG: shikimate kinase [Pseudomonadota bacterium]
MNVFITGVSCVGKSTVGPKLAEELGYRFVDLDLEIEKCVQTGEGHERSQAVRSLLG